MTATRSYHSPGRTAQGEQTRRAIIDVFIAQLGDPGRAALSPAAAARAAGVSIRTVHRYSPDADAQLALDDALANGDLTALTGLPQRILGRVAFQVLAGLAEPGPRSTKELYRGSPYGVGYFAGAWQL